VVRERNICAVRIDCGMPSSKVFVVCSGPSLSRIKPLHNPAMRRGRRSLVGYVGVIGKQEGLDLLLESVAYLRRVRARNDVQFAIVGGEQQSVQSVPASDARAAHPRAYGEIEPD
jgi:glycosyltransferase involved in cell wall biosynthesis